MQVSPRTPFSSLQFLGGGGSVFIIFWMTHYLNRNIYADVHPNQASVMLPLPIFS